MSSVLHRNLLERPPFAIFGRASAIITNGDPFGEEPTAVADISSGAGVTCFGHSCRAVKAAMVQQINELPYVHASSWTVASVEDLATMLLKEAGPAFIGGAVMFLNTGAEAVEAACKLAMQYHSEQGKRSVSCQFVGRANSYHGNTMFTLDLGDHPRKRAYRTECTVSSPFRLPLYAPLREGADYSGLDRLAIELDAPSGWSPRIGAVVVETIGGMTAGIEPTTPAYLAELKRVCTNADTPLILDEVLCGNFRTGKMFAWQYYENENIPDLSPDMITVGKGLTAGYFPLSAVIVKPHIVERIRVGSGRLWHSTTNQNHPIGCAAGVAAMRLYRSLSYRIVALAEVIDTASRELKLPLTGVGTLRGLRLPADCLAAFKESVRPNVVCYADSGGVKPDEAVVLIAPPYSMSNDELRAALQIISVAYQATCVA